MQIFISCGHNNARNWINDHGKWRLGIYKDQGATSGSDTEYKYSRHIADQIGMIVQYDPRKVIVWVPEGLNLQDRIAWINKRSTPQDIAIELHMDSAIPQAEGCSTWYLTESEYAKGKARDFQMLYTNITGIKGRGVHGDMSNRLGRLAFVRDTKPMAFLLEMGFISNPGDRTKVWNKAAAGIAQAIEKIL